MNREIKLQIRDVQSHITCKLCNGYFVDATTIIECLHSFCRTCIVKYLNENKSCPVCRAQVHKTRPLLNIRHDQTLQDIVYSLVPRLRHEEMKRRRNFWQKNKEHMEWRIFTPEELGEVDETDRRKATTRICLSIEPTKFMKNKLPEKSEWSELERSLQKRYVRCSPDVTIHHLHKFIKLKLQENEMTEVLVFVGDKILPENFSLSDVMEIFPCSFGETLDLTFGIYIPKATKRKSLVKVTSSTTSGEPAPKKKRLPSATPQLKAFFNSQINSKKLKPLQNSKSEELSDAKKHELLQMVNLQSVNNMNIEKRSNKIKEMQSEDLTERVSVKPDVEIKTEDVPEKTKEGPENATAGSLTFTIEDLAIPNNHTLGKPLPKDVLSEKEAGDKGMPPTTIDGASKQDKLESDVKIAANASALFSPVSDINVVTPSTSNGRGTKKNNTSNVECYTMITIPLDEAVRSKPPTPVEVPGEAPFLSKTKRPPESKRPFVVTSLTSDSTEIKQSKNRRKPSHPVHNVQVTNLDAPKKAGLSSHPLIKPAPKPSEQVGKFDTFRISPAQTAGQFILLTTQAPTQGNAKQPTSSQTDLNKARTQQKKFQLSVDSPGRSAADLAINEAGKSGNSGEKRHFAPKRPILPKTTGVTNKNISLLVQNPIPTSVMPTRNIFQNEKIIYPMTSVARPTHQSKQSVVPAATQKTAREAAAARNTSSIDYIAQLRHQQILLKKMQDAIDNPRQETHSHQLQSASPRSGPPPPYRVPTSVSVSPQNKRPSLSRSNLTSILTNIGPPRFSNANTRIAQQSGERRKSLPSQQTVRASNGPHFTNSQISRALSQSGDRPNPVRNSAITNLVGSANAHIPVCGLPTSLISTGVTSAGAPPIRSSPAQIWPNHTGTSSIYLSGAGIASQNFASNGPRPHSRNFSPSKQAVVQPVRSRHLSAGTSGTGVSGAPLSQSLSSYSRKKPVAAPHYTKIAPRYEQSIQAQLKNFPLSSTSSIAAQRINSSVAGQRPNPASFHHLSRSTASQRLNPPVLQSSIPKSRSSPSLHRRILSGPSYMPKGPEPHQLTKESPRMSQRQPEKKKPNILRRSPSKQLFPIATPPTGTKSPWSRNYLLPPDYIPAAKKPKISSPPPAHQHHSTALSPSFNLGSPSTHMSSPSTPGCDMPLELTSKAKKATHVVVEANPLPSSDEPLCLVKEK